MSFGRLVAGPEFGLDVLEFSDNVGVEVEVRRVGHARGDAEPRRTLRRVYRGSFRHLVRLNPFGHGPRASFKSVALNVLNEAADRRCSPDLRDRLVLLRPLERE